MVKKRYIVYFVFFLIACIFTYIRVTIIASGNVIYTYDQGRDFLAGARMISDRNPVFIGPTTGMGGVFHGVWWYYITCFSFLVFGPNPTNFYYLLFVIHFVTLITFFFGMKKLFDAPTAIWTCAVVTVGGYFIGAHTFAGNNIMAIPPFVFFLLLLGLLLRSKPKTSLTRIMVLVFGLTIGFVSEFELSFGMFLVPTVLILLLFSKPLRLLLKDVLTLIAFVGGITIPFLPRILFEIKNHFLQTKVILSFFIKPKLYHPYPYTKVFWDRLKFFKENAELAFANEIILITVLIVVVCLVVFLVYQYRKRRYYKEIHSGLAYPMHIVFVLVLLFVLSLGYRDPFWANYYEGVQYGFLVLAGGIIYLLSHINKKMYHGVIIILVIATCGIATERIMGIRNNSDKMEGLKIQTSIVNYITNIQKKKGERIFCARVFTPPVIPYTYDYLWLWKYLSKEIETPRYDYINGRCWYIIEPEWKGYEFRQVAWKKSNIPGDVYANIATHKNFAGIDVIEYVSH